MSEIVVCIDTSTEVIALALGTREGLSVTAVASRDTHAARESLSRLFPLLEQTLDEAGLTVDAITEVVVGRGPGSFTGVRIGVASAKGLAHGLGVPLCGVSTLDAVAWRHGTRDGLVAVVGDAMRGEVYPALFRVEAEQVVRLTPDLVAHPAEVARQWADSTVIAEAAAGGDPLRIAGNGLRKYREMFESSLGDIAEITPEDLWWPSGDGLLAAYADAIRRGDEGSGDPGELLPIYTRLSDAEENERARRFSPDGSGVHPSGVVGPGGGETP